VVIRRSKVTNLRERQLNRWQCSYCIGRSVCISRRPSSVIKFVQPQARRRQIIARMCTIGRERKWNRAFSAVMNNRLATLSVTHTHANVFCLWSNLLWWNAAAFFSHGRVPTNRLIRPSSWQARMEIRRQAAEAIPSDKLFSLAATKFCFCGEGHELSV